MLVRSASRTGIEVVFFLTPVTPDFLRTTLIPNLLRLLQKDITLDRQKRSTLPVPPYRKYQHLGQKESNDAR